MKALMAYKKRSSFVMVDTLNSVQHGDCIKSLNAMQAGIADLVFADPPFNIGYDYDVYEDSLGSEKYIAWSKDWISAVHRVLKDNGTFWLAIGDEYAAELKLASQRIGFHCRSWVIWYYTFGVNCSRKFSRSHAHLFHFVKDPNDFVFRSDEADNRIPSARQLVYADKRANPKGRLPDDTWIIGPSQMTGEMTTTSQPILDADVIPSNDEETFVLRPQDLEARFQTSEDTWYFPRVAGTFKERAGFHGCQMPEQLLGRIIRLCSQTGELVIDPFSGSATTLAVAKKLARRYLGFDLSEDYVKFGNERLAATRAGDRLEGSAEPTLSAPMTSVSKNQRSKRKLATLEKDHAAIERNHRQKQLEMTIQGVAEAFAMSHDGYSADRVVTDAKLNESFASACERLGLAGDLRTWNILLFRLRKAGKLVDYATKKRTTVSWEDCDRYLFASEIALQMVLSNQEMPADSVDEVLCDPLLVAEFDKLAARFAPGFDRLAYRWAALKLRKQAKLARTRGAVLAAPSRLGEKKSVDALNANTTPDRPGVYLLTDRENKRLYVGESLNLRERIAVQFSEKSVRKHWLELGDDLQIQFRPTQTSPSDMLAWQSCLVSKYRPLLNYQELKVAG